MAVRTAGAGNVRVLTSDDCAASIARRYRVRRIADEGLGLNADLEFACQRLLSDLADDAEILVLPIDLPFVQPAALEDMTDCKDDVVIAPDERSTDTNALLMRPAAVRCLPFVYGPGSFAAHVGVARKLNLSVRVVEHWRLAFDIDEPAQYFRGAIMRPSVRLGAPPHSYIDVVCLGLLTTCRCEWERSSHCATLSAESS